MITSFHIQNFRSILDLTLDFTYAEGKAPNGYKEAEVMPFFEKGGKRVVPCLAFFGANASGKTNIIKALKALDQMVLNGAKPKDVYEPNELYRKYADTQFRLEFTYEDTLFEYRICFDCFEIKSERLSKNGDVLYEIKAGLLFPFHKIINKSYDQLKLTDILRVECSDGEGRQNRLFLSRIGESYAGLHADLKTAHDFFLKKIQILDNEHTVPLKASIEFLAQAMNFNEDAALKEITEVIRRLDIDIQKIDFAEDQSVVSTYLIRKSDSGLDQNIKIRTEPLIHSIRMDVTGNPVYLNFVKTESAGTQRLAGLVGLILYSLKVGGVFVVDELECSLHALLLREILSLYKNRRHNATGAQLIFTTHNTDILDDSVLRLSEIALVRKTVANGTIVRRLAEFKNDGEDLRNVHNFRKQYLAGFYSAIPHPAL